jgi:hypothetical protein
LKPCFFGGIGKLNLKEVGGEGINRGRGCRNGDYEIEEIEKGFEDTFLDGFFYFFGI